MSSLFYTKRSRVSRIRAITDTDTGEEKRTGEVPTLTWHTLDTKTLFLIVLSVVSWISLY